MSPKFLQIMTTDDRKCFAMLGFAEAIICQLIECAKPGSRRYNKLVVCQEKIQQASDTYPGALNPLDRERMIECLVKIEELICSYVEGESNEAND